MVLVSTDQSAGKGPAANLGADCGGAVYVPHPAIDLFTARGTANTRFVSLGIALACHRVTKRGEFPRAQTS